MTINLEGDKIEVEPQAVRGLGLLCKLPAGPHSLETSLIVMDWQASDPGAFWAAWERLGGAGQGLVWESGEPFKAPVQAVPGLPAQSGRGKRAMPGWLKWLLGRFFEI